MSDNYAPSDPNAVEVRTAITAPHGLAMLDPLGQIGIGVAGPQVNVSQIGGLSLYGGALNLQTASIVRSVDSRIRPISPHILPPEPPPVASRPVEQFGRCLDI